MKGRRATNDQAEASSTAMFYDDDNNHRRGHTQGGAFLQPPADLLQRLKACQQLRSELTTDPERSSMAEMVPNTAPMLQPWCYAGYLRSAIALAGERPQKSLGIARNRQTAHDRQGRPQSAHIKLGCPSNRQQLRVAAALLIQRPPWRALQQR